MLAQRTSIFFFFATFKEYLIIFSGLTPASPFTKGPATVGLPINIGGQKIESGDVIVADRDGVVVVPYSKIDFVINRLSQVADLEYSLDAQVRGGLKIPDPVKEMILDDNVKFENGKINFGVQYLF